jgi:hypothetical protein
MPARASAEPVLEGAGLQARLTGRIGEADRLLEEHRGRLVLPGIAQDRAEAGR